MHTIEFFTRDPSCPELFSTEHERPCDPLNTTSGEQASAFIREFFDDHQQSLNSVRILHTNIFDGLLTIVSNDYYVIVKAEQYQLNRIEWLLYS